ncbi:MAG: hypothetical protein ACYDHP_09525 [Ferrimicrobium sp.]
MSDEIIYVDPIALLVREGRWVVLIRCCPISSLVLAISTLDVMMPSHDLALI